MPVSEWLNGSPGAELGHCSWESTWLDRASCGLVLMVAPREFVAEDGPSAHS